MYIIFCWCFGIHHIKEKLCTLIKLISTCANYIVDVIKYLTYDCIALRRSSHRSPTLTKSIFRIKHVKSRSEQRIARHQLVYCPNPAYSDAKYHVIKTPRPKYTQVYLYKSLESSRSSDILFYNEHSSIYMPMHPTVRPIYWVIYMYIFWTIMRERERWRSMRGSKKGSPPPKNSNFVIFNVLRVNLREKSYPRFFYDTYVITLIANQTTCTHACA